MNNINLQKNLVYTTSATVDKNLSIVWGDKEEVLENRKKFLEKQGISLKDCVIMQVEHEDKVIFANSSHTVKNTSSEAVVVGEALITQEKNVILFLLTADCLPVSFYDPVQNVIALAHLGWKPTNLQLVKKVVKTLSEKYNSQPKDIIVLIGPSIRKESHIFKDPVQKSLPKWRPFLNDLPSGETAVDLLSYNTAQLVESGVLLENINTDPTNTATSPNYFSHYRSVRTGEPEGRFATILGMK